MTADSPTIHHHQRSLLTAACPSNTDLSDAWLGALSPRLPKLLKVAARRATGLDRLEELYASLQRQTDALPFCQRLLQQLDVRYSVDEIDLKRIPRSGSTILVANHPFGMLDGVIWVELLSRLRSDVKLMANSMLQAIPELCPFLIPVDPFAQRPGEPRNQRGVAQAIDHLSKGGLLVLFPAGEVSHANWLGEVADSAWLPTAARLASRLERRGHQVEIVAAHVHGQNSRWFQILGWIHPRLRTALLGRELLNKQGARIAIHIGIPISAKKLAEIPTPAEQTRYLRWRSDLLAQRAALKANTRLPLLRRITDRARTPAEPEPEAIADPVPIDSLAEEIASLPEDRRLAESGDLAAYLAPAQLIPNIFHEIGRMREISFRQAGEGTGRNRDLDRFDKHYLHLFLWDRRKLRIAGAYRLGMVDRIRRTEGLSGLYTATLFHYSDEFLDKLGPAVELGRSFVSPEYQRSFAALLLLWKGIGAFIGRNPHYCNLFGPVSISSQYPLAAQRLMVRFLRSRAWLSDLAALVTARTPFIDRARQSHDPFQNAAIGLPELSSAITDLEPAQPGVPVLLRQYLKLGGKLIGFNVDPAFANVLDGLIVVDLLKTEPKTIQRYFGDAHAANFFRFHQTSSDAASPPTSRIA